MRDEMGIEDDPFWVTIIELLGGLLPKARLISGRDHPAVAQRLQALLDGYFEVVAVVPDVAVRLSKLDKSTRKR